MSGKVLLIILLLSVVQGQIRFGRLHGFRRGPAKFTGSAGNTRGFPWSNTGIRNLGAGKTNYEQGFQAWVFQGENEAICFDKCDEVEGCDCICLNETGSYPCPAY
jgi:hypothetical protein